MNKRITVLGSTGSLGKQALDVISKTDGLTVSALAAGSDIDTLEKQILDFKPDIAAVSNENKALALKERLHLKGAKTEILSGPKGVLEAAAYSETDLVMNMIVGFAGLMPTVSAIKSGKTIALANKETLVSAGEYIMGLAQSKNVSILPVDGEHSAIFQCLRGNEGNEINRLYITASGGPFRGYSKERLKAVTVEQALKHPTWSMGKKITIDSATLMNKGLEVIEARFLFNTPADKIQVLVHPQSIVHSMVEFADGAVMAELAAADMRLPIQYAINYPNRLEKVVNRLDFMSVKELTFEEPDIDAFPCLGLAYKVLKEGGVYPAVLNAANEAAVSMFLEGIISFTDISVLIERTLLAYTVKKSESFTSDSSGGPREELSEIISADNWARAFVTGNRIS